MKEYRFRFNFITIEPTDYKGGKYDPLMILKDIERKLHSHIERAGCYHEKHTPLVSVDYYCSSLGELEQVKNIIKKTYGVIKTE